MPTQPTYKELAAFLESKRIGSYLQGSDQLVISNQNPALPSSNSFWAMKRDNAWYLGTWSPAIYEVPSGDHVCEACEKIFRSSPTAISVIHDDLVAQFHLRRLTDEEIEELGLG